MDVYRDNLQKELSGLLEAPVTPVIIPPKVMRVLIFPYPDKTLLFMPRYIYMMIDEPEWVIGNYLFRKTAKNKFVFALTCFKFTPVLEETVNRSFQKEKLKTQFEEPTY